MKILELDPKTLLTPNALRDRDPGHVEKLIWSIQSHGQEEPARAYKDEKGKITLINGHSRREACEKLGIPLKVVLEDKPSDLVSYLITDHSRKNPDMGARFSELVNRMMEESKQVDEDGKTAEVSRRLGYAGIPRDTEFIKRRLNDRKVLIDGGIWELALKESWGAKRVEATATEIRIVSGKTAPKTVTEANKQPKLTAAAVGAIIGDVDLTRVKNEDGQSTWKLEISLTAPTTVPSDTLARWISGVLDPRALVD